MWVLELLEDVESDMSVFHRVDDIFAMPAVRFFTLAERLPAYQGIVQVRVHEYLEEQEQDTDDLRQPPAVPAFANGKLVDVVPDFAAKAHSGFQGDDRNPPVFGPRGS